MPDHATTVVNQKILKAGELARLSAEGKITLSRGVDKTTRDIARAYAKAWGEMSKISRELAEHAAEQIHAGIGLSPREIANLDRVNRALRAMSVQMHELNRFAGVKVAGHAGSTAREALDQLTDDIARTTGVDRSFTKPTSAAMQGLILRSTERITSARNRLDDATESSLKDALFRGLVLGENPQVTARHIVDKLGSAFFGGLARANNVARTEILDAHRYASQVAYNATPVVQGWKWLATLDNRTCPACWAKHDSFHPTTEILLGHQQCRCTMVPIGADENPNDVDLGNPADIFWSLPREDQLKIMGPGRLAALEAGVPFSALAMLRPNTNWRPSYGATSVADLTGLANLRLNALPDSLRIPGESTASLLDTVFKQGGITIQSLTGEQPTEGFVVARNGSSLVLDAREFFGPGGPSALAEWMRLHGDELDQPGAHMGLWWDKDNGKVVADVVQILKDRDAAIALGRAEDQISIFDLGKFEEIQTGGTGGYADPHAKADVAVGGTFDPTVKPKEGDISIGLGGDTQFHVGRLSFKPDGRPQVTDVDGRVWTLLTTPLGLPPEGSRVKGVPSNDFGTTVEGRLAYSPNGARVVTDDGRVIDVDAKSINVVKASLTPKQLLKYAVDLSVETTKSTGINVNLGLGKDQKIIDDSARAISQLALDWPDAKPNSLSINQLNNFPNSYAVTFSGPSHKPDINLNPTLMDSYENFNRRYQMDLASGFHGKGTGDDPVKAIIDHEFAHNLVTMLTSDSGPDRIAFLGKAMDAVRRNLGHDGKMLGWDDLGVHVNKLSGYALQSIDEGFGEALAFFRANGPGKSIVADTLVKALATQYRKKYGHLPPQPGVKALFKRDWLLNEEPEPSTDELTKEFREQQMRAGGNFV